MALLSGQEVVLEPACLFMLVVTIDNRGAKQLMQLKQEL
jgi:hypothetical protein